MSSKLKLVFLCLVLMQGLHSVEEYYGQLWTNFPPAKYLVSLFSENPKTGFLIPNITLFIIGLWCYLIPVRKNYGYAKNIAWFWVALELINGLGHPAWSLYNNAYTPGLVTAFLLLCISIFLGVGLLNSSSKI